jgi:flavodoxin
MKVLVAYEGQSQPARKVAEAIAAEARNLGNQTTLKSLGEVNAYDTQTADVLFLGTWAEGMLLNVKPAGAARWVPALPSLRGKAVATFCTYGFRAGGALRKLNALLEEQGARIMGDQAFSNGSAGKNVESFVSGILNAVEMR